MKRNVNIVEKFGITPGPWSKDYGGTEHHIKSVGYKEVGTPTVCRYNDDFKDGGKPIVADNLTEEERQANGKLIAAAPEMLEALIIVLRNRELGEYESQHCGLPRMTEANALGENAIEKATGKTWEEIKDLL